MSKQSIRRTRVALILIAVFVFFAICLGSYHVTHGGGWRSGTAELFFAVLVGILANLFWRARSGSKASARVRLIRNILVGVLIPISLTLLILSVYHFTHHGLRSGIIELTSTIMLSATNYLLVKSPKPAAEMAKSVQSR